MITVSDSQKYLQKRIRLLAIQSRAGTAHNFPGNVRLKMRAFIFVCSLISCTAVLAAEAVEPSSLTNSSSAEQSKVVSENLSTPVQNLLQLALELNGAPYHKGGLTPQSGFDCSGFVRYIFAQIKGGWGILPHKALAISKLGTPINLSELQPGDLVFFRFARRTISHVGIYLGNNQFIHASSYRTGGVIISSLSSDYWEKRFMLARRLDGLQPLS